MNIFGVPAKEYRKRRENLIGKLPDKSVAIIPSNIDALLSITPYRQASNFLYFTGYERDKSILILFKNGKMKKSFFVTEENDPTMELWVGKRPKLDYIREHYLFDNVIPAKKFNSFLSRLLKNSDNLYFYFPPEPMEILGQERILSNKLKEKYPYLAVQPLLPIISKLRRKKSKSEINLIKKAIEITREGILNGVKEIKPGKYEYQVQAALEYGFRYNGSRNNAFSSIIASGINSTILHYSENNSRIPENGVILFDVGSEYNYYASDISRTFPTSRRFSRKQKNIYEAVLDAQKVVIKRIKPGKTFKDLNELTVKLLSKAMLKLKYIKDKKDIVKYYYHGVSHPIGLDIHDLSDNNILEVGDVISCEPGLYVREEKIGVRIEDDILVTKEGAQVLSDSIPKEINDIYNLF